MVDAAAFGYTHYPIPFAGSFFEATLLEFDVVQLPNYYHFDDISVVAAAEPEPSTSSLALSVILLGVPLALYTARRGRRKSCHQPQPPVAPSPPATASTWAY